MFSLFIICNMRMATIDELHEYNIIYMFSVLLKWVEKSVWGNNKMVFVMFAAGLQNVEIFLG